MIAVKPYIRYSKISSDIAELYTEIIDELGNLLNGSKIIDDLEYMQFKEEDLPDIEIVNEVDLNQFLYESLIIPEKNKEYIEKILKEFVLSKKENSLCLIIGYKTINRVDEITDFYKNFIVYLYEKFNIVEIIPVYIGYPQCEVVEM